MKLAQIFVAAAVALVSVVSATDPNSQSLWEVFEFDKNPARFEQLMNGVYRAFTFDQDGNITPESLDKAFQDAKKQRPSDVPESMTEQQFIQTLDANGDGKVNKRELKEFYK
jgi:transcriptional regulator of aromatic amino acid metabolism